MPDEIISSIGIGDQARFVQRPGGFKAIFSVEVFFDPIFKFFRLCIKKHQFEALAMK